jgi:predicted DNA-binding protein (MmcQ/YjbR family)
MTIEQVRRLCLSLPHVTETVQWGDHLVFKTGGKIFAIVALEPGGDFLSLKVTPENFAALTEREGIDPAPYLARASWVALRSPEALRGAELQPLLREAYELVFAKLPKKTREALSSSAAARPSRTGRTR